MKNQLLDATKKVESGRGTKSAPESGSVRDDLIRLAAKMLMNRGNYPLHPENQDFKMSKRAWRELSAQYEKGDEFFRQIGIELRALADRLPNDQNQVERNKGES